tara:strand:+ start:369 stop:539 length:171 start_codon:yes stop_codon:yes gene_type:complete
MKIPEHIYTSIVIKLNKIKNKIENENKSEAISGINSLLDEFDKFETNGQVSKRTIK